jgi:hypothetical protein
MNGDLPSIRTEGRWVQTWDGPLNQEGIPLKQTWELNAAAIELAQASVPEPIQRQLREAQERENQRVEAAREQVDRLRSQALPNRP